MESLFDYRIYLALLGGSWAIISEVISSVTIIITHIRGLLTPLKITHEPPSKRCNLHSGWKRTGDTNIGALRIRIAFWGP